MNIPSFDEFITESSNVDFDINFESFKLIECADNSLKINLEDIDPYFENLLNEYYNELLEIKDIRDEWDPDYTPGAIVKAGIATWLSGIVAWKLKDIVEPYVITQKGEKFIKQRKRKAIRSWVIDPNTGKKVEKIQYVGKGSKNFLRLETRGKIAKKKITQFLRNVGRKAGKTYRFLRIKMSPYKKAAVIGLILTIVAAAAATFYKMVAKRKTEEYKREQAIKRGQKEIDAKLAAKIEQLKKEEAEFIKRTQMKIEDAKKKAMAEKDPDKLQAMIEAGWKADIENYN